MQPECTRGLFGKLRATGQVVCEEQGVFSQCFRSSLFTRVTSTELNQRRCENRRLWFILKRLLLRTQWNSSSLSLSLSPLYGSSTAAPLERWTSQMIRKELVQRCDMLIANAEAVFLWCCTASSTFLALVTKSRARTVEHSSETRQRVQNDTNLSPGSLRLRCVYMGNLLCLHYNVEPPWILDSSFVVTFPKKSTAKPPERHVWRKPGVIKGTRAGNCDHFSDSS